MKPRKILATILVSAFVVLMMTGVAYAATTNSFGRTYSGITNNFDFNGGGCLGCHATDAASWGTGAGPFVTAPNAHSSMVTSIPGNLGAVEPGVGSGYWPSWSRGGSSYWSFTATDNVQFMLGGPGLTKEYVAIPGSALQPGSFGGAVVPSANTNGLGNEYPLIDGTNWDPTMNEWMLEAKVSTPPYFQRCGGCHNVGVTKPSYPGAGMKSLVITGSVDPTSTPTTWAALSIQCETCHGTGNVGNTPANNNHAGTGVSFVGYGSGNNAVKPNLILQAGVCGQCHATGSALAADLTYIKRYDSASSNMSSPQGFTTNNVGAGLIPGQNSILSFFDIKTIDTPGAVWPAAGYAFYPNGANKGMNHGYFNEYVSAVARDSGGTVAPWDTTRTVGVTVVPGGRGHINSWTMRSPTRDAKCFRCHSGDGRLAYIGRSLDPVNGKNIVSQSSFVETNFAGTDATTTPIAGVTCQVCHTAHSSTENTAAGGLGIREGAGCADCHNWQYEVLETPAAQRPSAANFAAGTATVSWGHPLSHPTRESVAGTGLIEVAPAGEFMEGVECVQCHMPETRAGRPTHSFLPMLPGDAKTWGVLGNGGEDSCSPCHSSLTLDQLQEKIDGWQESFVTQYAATDAAVTAVLARKGWTTSITSTTSTDPEIVALKIAKWNSYFTEAEGSEGVHNPPYLAAGLTYSKMLADAIGGNVTGVPGASVVRVGDKVAFVGTATNGSGTGAAGATVVLQSSPDGTVWTDVVTVTADGSGNYVAATGAISATTQFRAKWIVRANPGELAYTSTPETVSIGTGGGVAVQRLWGPSRYGTSVAASLVSFAESSCANIVVCTGQNFPDALSAAGLAGQVESPILLIGKKGDPLPQETLDEIQRISTKDGSGQADATVWFIGGSGVLPDSWMDDMQVALPGIETTRLAGDTRYGTSAAVASKLAQIQGASFKGIGIAAYGKNYPDALAAGAVAYGQAWPVLLVSGTLSDPISEVLTDDEYKTVYTVGGSGVMPDSVLAEIEALPVTPAIDAVRATDPDDATRYDTAADFADWAITNHFASASYVGVATGQNYPDALSASGPVGINGGVLVLVKTDSVPMSTSDFLTNYHASVSKAVIFGGPGVVTPTVFEEISTILNP